MNKTTKYFGIIVGNDRFYYTFAEKLESKTNLVFTLNTQNYVLDIGTSIKTGRCSLAGNQGRID